MPGAGAAINGNCPFEGAYKAKAALAGGIRLGGESLKVVSWGLPFCSPKVSLPFLVVSPPDRGRRVRYGKLRFPSCTPFHPPGAPLPFRGRHSSLPFPFGF